MSEVYEHNPGDHEDPLPGPTWIVALLGAVLLVVIGMGLTALTYNAQHQEVVRKSFLQEPAELIALRAEQTARLHAGPHYEISTDAQGKTHKAIVIPIDRAMDKIVNEYGK